MTTSETIGMIARLANRLSGETRWKCHMAKSAVALPAMMEVMARPLIATRNFRVTKPSGDRRGGGSVALPAR
jgi:hypothetical protein